MKWKLKSHPLFLWGWIIFIVLIPMIVFYVYFGEFNVSNNNWLVAKTQHTPVFWYPINQKDFNSEWIKWVNGLPNVYHEYFKNLGSESYVNLSDQSKSFYYDSIGNLILNNQIQSNPLAVDFKFPFASFNGIAILYWFLFLLGNGILLAIYHLLVKFQKIKFLISTEGYAFLVSFWLVMFVIYLTGLMPGFNNHDDNKVWYVILIRIVLILIAGFIGFYFPFKIHVHFFRYFNPLEYYESIKNEKKENDDFQKTKITKVKRDSITLKEEE